MTITGPGSVRLRTTGPPAPRPGWARVRVRACGVCGTDAHYLNGMALPPGVAYPVVPGHEVAGTVAEIAPADAVRAGVAVGDLVMPHLIIPCGTCEACASGREQLCPTAPILGIHEPGGLADELLWPVDRLVPATGIDPVAAAVLPDAVATAHHALTTADVPRGGLLCVYGAGGVGTAVLMLARALDPGVRLAAVVRGAATARRVGALGVSAFAGATARDVRAAVGSADAVIDFTGSPDTPSEAVKVLRPGGRLVAGSVAPGDLGLGRLLPFVTREVTVSGTYTSTIDDLRRVAGLVRDGHLDVSGLVSHRLPLDRAAEAFDLLARRPDGLVRVVVEP
ncbi:MAG TPA: alcohol dehydrogenase catalytic domain-containing protein [Streptosporangiaceae bacterium]|jgi:2-desacetyl-2-hydroxyethyl bacteriochlorophyllide A dehydrogenase